jgi:hypothetical protein
LAGSYNKGDITSFLTTKEEVASCICEIEIAANKYEHLTLLLILKGFDDGV